jgi:predicted metal-binding membrane protein
MILPNLPARLRWRTSMTLAIIVIILAWMLAIALNLSGSGAHTQAFSSPWSFLLGIVSWLLMVVAMMLPSSLGLLRLMQHAAKVQAERGSSEAQIMGCFFGAYLGVWLGFAIFAWGFDAIIHTLVNLFASVRENVWLLAPFSLALAGAFQFSSLKGKCLHACRNPASFFTLYYRKGVHGAANLGLKHGLHCLGCCWALMLVMFAVGSNDLVWMVALTAITMIERLGPHGDLLRKPIGVGLLFAAVFLGYTLIPV